MLKVPILFLLLLSGCDQKNSTDQDMKVNQNTSFADITAVSASGKEGNFTFNVTISSPDTGCDQYADWWEVISMDGKLLYRRILRHSHVNEQPFTRSGGPVAITANQEVWIRGHMNNTGYGGQTFRGNAAAGFESTEMPEDFALDLEKEEPLPDDCAF